jgi:DNA polymerase
MPKVAVIDFESRAQRDLRRTGVESYVECPEFSPSCLSWCFDDEDGIDQPIVSWDCRQQAPSETSVQELFDHVALGGTVVAHNARFEYCVWNEMHRREPALWPRLDLAQLVDTMAMARAAGMPAALFDLACALRLPLEKDAAGHSLMLKLCKPRRPLKHEKHLTGTLWHEAPEDLTRQVVYCERDVAAERLAWRRLPALPAIEAATWQFDQRMNDRGIRVDLDAARHCLALVQFEKQRLNDRLERLTGGYVKTSDSTDALKTWLAARDCPIPDLRKLTVETWLARPDIEDECREALMIRQECSRSGVAKLQAAILGACRDGRLHGLLEYWAALTGRWAGRRFQPHNMMRCPESFNEHDTEEVFAWAAL